MKNLALALLLSLCFNLQVQADEIKLHCLAEYNSSFMESELTVEDFAKETSLGEIEEFEIFVKSLGNKKIEISALDTSRAFRTYATATLGDQTSDIQLSVWKRDSLLEVICTLIK